jgi:hypothetical protein
MVLNVDGFVHVDPAIALRDRTKAFVAGRTWRTTSIYYGDQPESEASRDAGKPMWSLCFCLGLDHVRKTTNGDWFADVAAIIGFVHLIARETGSEFTVEFRLASRLWYSETITIVSDDPVDAAELESVRSMLQHFIRPKRDDRFIAGWGHTRVFGKRHFVWLEGVAWVGLTAAFCLGLSLGYGLKAEFSLARCIAGVVAGLALGYGVGVWRWNRAERRFAGLTWKSRPPAGNTDA